MGWTSPTTQSTGHVVTAAEWNTDLVDNLKETAPAKVTTAGDIVYATAVNAIARLPIGTASQVLAVNSGADAPEWTDELTVAQVTVSGIAPGFYFTETDEDSDQWRLVMAGGALYLEPEDTDAVLHIRNVANSDVFNLDTATGHMAVSGSVFSDGIAQGHGSATTANPTLKADTTDPTLGADAVSEGWYERIHDLVVWHFFIDTGAVGYADGSGDVYLTPPVTPNAAYNDKAMLGWVHLRDTGGAAHYLAAVEYDQGNNRVYFVQESSTVRTDFASSVPFAWNQNDVITGTLIYRA